jgi:TrmH family RNA methyltransferase
MVNEVKSGGVSADIIKLAVCLSTNKKIPDTLHLDSSIPYESLFITEGSWAIPKILEHKVNFHYFLYDQSISLIGSDSIIAQGKQLANESVAITSKACKRISERKGADSFFCICSIPPIELDSLGFGERENSIIAVLDGLEQPGNIGAIIRSCDAAGVDAVIVVNRVVKMTNSRIIRGALGSTFNVPFFEMSFADAVVWLNDNKFKVFLTDLTATENYCDQDYSGHVAVVAGNEFKGISPAWYDSDCDYSKIIIPMFGNCESLNVGFATTMVVYEACLQQRGFR